MVLLNANLFLGETRVGSSPLFIENMLVSRVCRVNTRATVRKVSACTRALFVLRRSQEDLLLFQKYSEIENFTKTPTSGHPSPTPR